MPRDFRSNQTSLPGIPHHGRPSSRREFLARAGGGFGALALAYLLGEKSARGAESSELSPLFPKTPHHRATAKSVIFLFMEGGPSHIDLFDPKPKVNEL